LRSSWPLSNSSHGKEQTSLKSTSLQTNLFQSVYSFPQSVFCFLSQMSTSNHASSSTSDLGYKYLEIDALPKHPIQLEINIQIH